MYNANQMFIVFTISAIVSRTPESNFSDFIRFVNWTTPVDLKILKWSREQCENVTTSKTNICMCTWNL